MNGPLASEMLNRKFILVPVYNDSTNNGSGIIEIIPRETVGNPMYFLYYKGVLISESLSICLKTQKEHRFYLHMLLLIVNIYFYLPSVLKLPQNFEKFSHLGFDWLICTLILIMIKIYENFRN